MSSSADLVNSCQRFVFQGAKADRGRAINKNIIVQNVIFAAVNLHSAEPGFAGGAALENISVDQRAGNRVIEPDAGLAALGLFADARQLPM